MWKTLSHIKKYNDPWVTAWSDDMEFPDGHKSTYGYLEFKDGAHVVVIDKNNNKRKPENGLQIKHEAEAGERKKKSYRVGDGEMMRSRCGTKNTNPQREA